MSRTKNFTISCILFFGLFFSNALPYVVTTVSYSSTRKYIVPVFGDRTLDEVIDVVASELGYIKWINKHGTTVLKKTGDSFLIPVILPSERIGGTNIDGTNVSIYGVKEIINSGNKLRIFQTGEFLKYCILQEAGILTNVKNSIVFPDLKKSKYWGRTMLMAGTGDLWLRKNSPVHRHQGSAALIGILFECLIIPMYIILPFFNKNSTERIIAYSALGATHLVFKISFGIFGSGNIRRYNKLKSAKYKFPSQYEVW